MNAKKKKIIVSCFFVILIALTVICTIVLAMKSYRFDMDPANGVDIMEGMLAAMLVMLGGFVIFYELDLFYTVYYFLFKPKTIAKSILNILCNLCLLLQFCSEGIARALSISEETIIAVALFLIYLILRGICVFASTISSAPKN